MFHLWAIREGGHKMRDEQGCTRIQSGVDRLKIVGGIDYKGRDLQIFTGQKK